MTGVAYKIEHEVYNKMLVSLVLTLESETSVLLPGALGRANYAALLERLNLVDNGLGRHVHDGSDGPKPVTCRHARGGAGGERGEEDCW